MLPSKIHILVIAPYKEMESMILRSAQSHPDVELDIHIGDLEAGVDIVKSIPEHTYDCIISRGGTASLIRQITDLPVIDIPLSVYDVLSAMKLAQNYSARYAIVGFPNITETAHTLCNLLSYDLDIFTVHHRDDVPEILNQLRERGYQMVVCDVITHTLALQAGLNAFLITSGMESIGIAIGQAREISRYFTRLRHENTFLRMIAREQNAQIILLEKDGTIVLSTPTRPSETLLEGITQKVPEISDTHWTKFYFTDSDTLYKITAQKILSGNNTQYLFYCIPSRISLHSHWIDGVRSMNRGECEYLVQNSFYSISGAMGHLSDEIQTMTLSKQPVMILGEPGTGKEQIARYLYLKCPLSHRPFLLINGQLMNDKSWNSLFRHNSSPLNELNMTLYIQHVDQISPQRLRELSALIRETGLSRRLRLIFSATFSEKSPLPEDVQHFIRQLSCFTLTLPTLRSRSDEIPSLASLYLSRLKMEHGKQLSGFEPHGLQMLRQFDWPYNYTQFKHILQSLAAMTDFGYVRTSTVAELLAREGDIQNPPSNKSASESKEGQRLEDIIYDALWQAIAKNKGNRTAAAKQLGISRTTLWRYLNGKPQQQDTADEQ